MGHVNDHGDFRWISWLFDSFSLKAIDHDERYKT
jgi:hypothetical protein